METIEGLLVLRGLSSDDIVSVKISSGNETQYFQRKDAQVFLGIDGKVAAAGGFDFEFEFRGGRHYLLVSNGDSYAFSERESRLPSELIGIPLDGLRMIRIWDLPLDVYYGNQSLTHSLARTFQAEDHSGTLGDLIDFINESTKDPYLSIDGVGKKGYLILWDFLRDIGLRLPDIKPGMLRLPGGATKSVAYY